MTSEKSILRIEPSLTVTVRSIEPAIANRMNIPNSRMASDPSTKARSAARKVLMKFI